MATTINAGNATSGAAISADTTGILQLQSGSTPTTAVTVDTAQNVGIGTSSPVYNLDIYNATNAQFALRSDTNAQSIVSRASTDTTAAAIQIWKSRGTQASPTIVGSTDIVGRLQFFGYDGAINIQTAEIRATVDGTPGTNDMPGRLGFYTTADGASTVTERGRFDSSGNFLFNSGYGSVATAYGCRAWVNFNGIGTPAIRASGNVTSITDNGVGDYTVNFTTAMPDADYGVSISGRQIAASNLYSSAVKSGTNPTASAVNIVSIAATGNAGDSGYIYVAIFR